VHREGCHKEGNGRRESATGEGRGSSPQTLRGRSDLDCEETGSRSCANHAQECSAAFSEPERAKPIDREPDANDRRELDRRGSERMVSLLANFHREQHCAVIFETNTLREIETLVIPLVIPLCGCVSIEIAGKSDPLSIA